jgi:putative cardiolipin synthase
MGVELYEVRSKLGSARGSGTNSEAMARYGHYSLHAKLFVFDRQRVFLGSMNFDKRSENINTEIGALIDSRELAEQVSSRFDAIAQPLNSYMLKLVPAQADKPEHLNWLTDENGQVVVYQTEPAASPWRRLWVDLMELYPFDDEL